MYNEGCIAACAVDIAVEICTRMLRCIVCHSWLQCVQCWTVLADGCSFMFSILSGFCLRDAMPAQVLSMALCLSVGPSLVGVLSKRLDRSS